MGLMRVIRALRRTNAFYPIIAAAIVVPNLVLGVYGYWAISNSAEHAHRQIEAWYADALTTARDQIQRELAEVTSQLPDTYAAPEASESAGVSAEEVRERQLRGVADRMLRDARRMNWVRGWYLLDDAGTPVAPESFSPPDADEAAANQPNDSVVASGGAVPLNEGAGERDGSAATWHPTEDEINRYFAFRRQIHPQLEVARRRTPRAAREEPIALRFADGSPYSPYQTCIYKTVRVGSAEFAAIAWLDLQALERMTVQPALTPPGADSPYRIDGIISPTGSRPVDSSRFLIEPVSRQVAPHWWIAIDAPVGENVRATTQTTVYLALIAIFIPFIGVGVFLMVRALVKDIREARQKTDFVSRVTHELKTPLTSIRLFIETLQMGGANDEAELQRCLTIIQLEAERLSKLIERVLDFGRMDVGNKVFHFKDDDVEEVVRGTLDFFRSQALEQGAAIKVYIERGIPIFPFDRDAVREVLLNLLENAIKYSVGDRSVAIRVTRDNWRGKDVVNIQVSDNGVGIRKEDIERIFDQFYRVDDRLTKGIDGSGIGLTLSREIARAHRGDIVVDSTPGDGSKFTLVLPVAGPDSSGSGAYRPAQIGSRKKKKPGLSGRVPAVATRRASARMPAANPKNRPPHSR